MKKDRRVKVISLCMSIIIMCTFIVSSRVSGEVKPITEAQEQLEGITKEEQETLEKLFGLTQEIEELEREESRLTDKIHELQGEIDELGASIDGEQKDYEHELYILEQVLVSYQRGGPASYLELLLQSEDLSGFLGNLSLIKDISRNVSELLETIEERRDRLAKEKEKLGISLISLEQKKEELKVPIEAKQKLRGDQEAYLTQLKEQKTRYEEHLNSLEIMWQDLKDIFSSIVVEFSRIIGEGHFTMEDMNLKFSFLGVRGYVSDETFNRILKENSIMSEIVFHFNLESVILEIPDKNLILEGVFELSGNTAIVYVVEKGSFYGMPLDQASIDELFKEGPLIIDFESAVGDLVTIEINLTSVEARDGNLNFTIGLSLPF